MVRYGAVFPIGSVRFGALNRTAPHRRTFFPLENRTAPHRRFYDITAPNRPVEHKIEPNRTVGFTISGNQTATAPWDLRLWKPHRTAP